MKPSKKKAQIFGVLLVILLGVGAYLLMHQGEISTDDAAFEATVNTVSPKVSGYIVKMHVINNQPVKAGEVLLEIDPTDYQIHVERAQALLNVAKARLGASSEKLETAKVSAPSDVDSAKAQVAQAQANWDNSTKALQRIQSLSEQARSQQQLDNAVAEEKITKAALDNAQAQLRNAESAPRTVAAAQANSDELAAAVKQAAADLAQAQSDLANTKVIAPVAGHVTNKGVQAGDYIQPGQQLLSVVAQDIYVVANFKETQLRNMRAGQPVSIHIDAFPHNDLSGKVQSIQYGTGARFSAFPPENATGNFVKIVQRVPVRILLTERPDPNLPLGPGMSVVPTVYTQ